MKKAYRKLKKEADAQIARRRFQRDGEGRILIDMTVKDDSDFISVYSRGEAPAITEDVADFLESETHSLPFEQPLTLRIHSDCIDEEEKSLYRKAIREYYTKMYIANEKELRRNKVITVILAHAGVLLLAAAILMESLWQMQIWSEVIDIAAWVMLWEAVDISVFENRAQKVKRMRCLSFMDMKVEYRGLKQ